MGTRGEEEFWSFAVLEIGRGEFREVAKSDNSSDLTELR
jgi:hypothetical protein